MEAVCQSKKIKYIFSDSSLVIIKNNKIIYDENIKNVVILHINDNKRFNQILWILYFVDQSKQFIDYFDKMNYLDGVQFIAYVKDNCQFLDLSRFQAESYSLHQKKQSTFSLDNNIDLVDSETTSKGVTSNSNNNSIVIHTNNNSTISKHDLKRNKIIQKMRERKLILFDIAPGIVHDHVNKTLPDIKRVPVLLHNGEICHYYSKVELETTKNVVVGSIGRSTGVKTRFSNSSIYTGNSIRQNVRADVIERFKGKFFITNKRIVFQSNKNGFEIDLKKLSNVTRKFNCVILQCGKDIYKINTSFPVLISEIIYVATESL